MECHVRLLQSRPTIPPKSQLLQIGYDCIDLGAVLAAEWTHNGKGASHQLTSVVYQMCTIVGGDPAAPAQKSKEFDDLCKDIQDLNKGNILTYLPGILTCLCR